MLGVFRSRRAIVARPHEFGFPRARCQVRFGAVPLERRVNTRPQRVDTPPQTWNLRDSPTSWRLPPSVKIYIGSESDPELPGELALAMVRTDNQNAFPVTHWSRLAALKETASGERRDALNFLAERYWKPVYCYVRRRGYEAAEAEDLVQEFFLTALASELFAKADPARGRFRNLLLKSVQHFLAKEWRDGHAQKRHPAEGLISIRELASEAGAVIVPKDTRTPEDAFHRAWLCELVSRVLRTLEREYLVSGKQVHIELFRARVIGPILDGAEIPSLRELSDRYGLSIKDIENRVITARRAYQRLLRDEIRLYAGSKEEVAEEIQDLWRLMDK